MSRWQVTFMLAGDERRQYDVIGMDPNEAWVSAWALLTAEHPAESEAVIGWQQYDELNNAVHETLPLATDEGETVTDRTSYATCHTHLAGVIRELVPFGESRVIETVDKGGRDDLYKCWCGNPANWYLRVVPAEGGETTEPTIGDELHPGEACDDRCLCFASGCKCAHCARVNSRLAVVDERTEPGARVALTESGPRVVTGRWVASESGPDRFIPDPEKSDG